MWNKINHGGEPTKNVDKKYLVQRGDLLISWSASIGVYFWKNDEENV